MKYIVFTQLISLSILNILSSLRKKVNEQASVQNNTLPTIRQVYHAKYSKIMRTAFILIETLMKLILIQYEEHIDQSLCYQNKHL